MIETLEFTLNGTPTRVDVELDETLLTVLRDRLKLTGTKGACLEGECGSCTVLLDGRPVNSCLTLAMQVRGRTVTTIEGLAPDGALSVIQQKFIETGAAQCGYCTPGLIMAAHALMQNLPAAPLTEDEVLTAMEGNICRCTGYASIVEAVRRSYRELTK